MRDLADLLGVTKQAASQLVDAMELGGYVHRRDDPDDARAKLVALTPRGRTFLGTVETIYRGLEDQWAAVNGRRRLEAVRHDVTTHGLASPRHRDVAVDVAVDLTALF